MRFGVGLAHAAPHVRGLAPARRARTFDLGEELARLCRKLADRHLSFLPLVVLELHDARVSLERREQRRDARIADLDERLDRRSHGLGIRVTKEPPEELRRAWLGNLGEQVRQLRQRRAPRGQAIERALDAERDLLEPIVRQPLERLARRVARLRLRIPRISMSRSTTRRPCRSPSSDAIRMRRSAAPPGSSFSARARVGLFREHGDESLEVGFVLPRANWARTISAWIRRAVRSASKSE